jgi:hypothetical protein
MSQLISVDPFFRSRTSGHKPKFNRESWRHKAEFPAAWLAARHISMIWSWVAPPAGLGARIATSAAGTAPLAW